METGYQKNVVWLINSTQKDSGKPT